jgi:hypothetical protein
MQITEILRLRSDFEELTNGFNMTEGSDINTLEWFIENGHRSNSLRNGFDDAKQIAIKILTEHNEWLKRKKNT